MDRLFLLRCHSESTKRKGLITDYWIYKKGSNLPITLMGLFNGHDLQDRNVLAIILDEQRIPARNMHPVTTVIQLLKIASRGPGPVQPGDMIPNDPPILFRKDLQKFYCIRLDE